VFSIKPTGFLSFIGLLGGKVEMKKKIDHLTAIIGLGYVGLPLALDFCEGRLNGAWL